MGIERWEEEKSGDPRTEIRLANADVIDPALHDIVYRSFRTSRTKGRVHLSSILASVFKVDMQPHHAEQATQRAWTERS